MAEGIRVEGLTRVVRELQKFGLDVEDLKDAFAKIADLAAAAASRNTPRKSGRLAADIRGNRAKSKAVVTAGRSSLPYAGPINYGWLARNIQPAGFMQKADEEMQPIALELLESEIDSAIQRRGLR